MKQFSIIILSIVLTLFLHAEELVGTVTSVHDGDTFRIGKK